MNLRDSTTSQDDDDDSQDRRRPDTVFEVTQPLVQPRAPRTGVLTRKVRDPDFLWMWRHPARILALGFGSGLITPAPGTWGTLAAWVSWLLLLHRAPLVLQAIVVVLAFAVGVWACNRTGRELGARDHSAIVWDEIAAFWLVLWLVPGTLLSQAFAFAVFRAFDILKPQPIRYFDARLKNGFGVMFDDTVAAFFTLLVFALYMRLFNG
jgi:phosphatidylglycerophosphatase A